MAFYNALTPYRARNALTPGLKRREAMINALAQNRSGNALLEQAYPTITGYPRRDWHLANAQLAQLAFLPNFTPVVGAKKTPDYITKSKRHFGLTTDFREAGYILPNGQMLDFSGQRQGSTTPGVRYMDHSEIQFLDDIKNKYDFLEKTGSIRYSDFGDYIYLGVSKPLTEKQLALLEKRLKPGVQVDVDITAGGDEETPPYNKLIDSIEVKRNPNIRAINLWIKRTLAKVK